jgi:hypothetical protein
VLHILDANVLIDANRDYYPIDRVPEFWDWLLYQGTSAQIKVPVEIWEEVAGGNDDLAHFMRQSDTKEALLLNEDVSVEIVSRVVSEGYASDLTDEEIARIGRDPFLVAYGLVDTTHRCVVTTESSRPARQRANRHLPDVCRQFGLASYNTFELTRRLDFRTQRKWP